MNFPPIIAIFCCTEKAMKKSKFTACCAISDIAHFFMGCVLQIGTKKSPWGSFGFGEILYSIFRCYNRGKVPLEACIYEKETTRFYASKKDCKEIPVAFKRLATMEKGNLPSSFNSRFWRFRQMSQIEIYAS